MGKPIFEKTYFAYIKKNSRAVVCSINGFDEKLVILKMNGQDSPNVQMDFAMSSDTYLLDFGEKLSPISISGIIPYANACSGVSTVKGQLSALYKKHKLGKSPVGVRIGADQYSAYITSKNTSVSAEQPEIINFSMSLLGYRVGGGGGGNGTEAEKGSNSENGRGSSSGIGSLSGDAFSLGGGLDIGSLSDGAFDLSASGRGLTSVDSSDARSLGEVSAETQGYLDRARLAYQRSCRAGLGIGYSATKPRNKYVVTI